ncbi:hypothetical protein ACFFX0_03005 [Citricoccus parietis]|uniref:Uncharacterized protein n=1 Tax=Citricoccus parietis TaxID=592307 RepID=A0ABV5FVA7_9MICC
MANVARPGTNGRSTTMMTAATTRPVRSTGLLPQLVWTAWTMKAPRTAGMMKVETADRMSLGIMPRSQLPSRPTNRIRETTWISPAAEMAAAAASWALGVPTLALMRVCAAMAEGRSLVEMFPMRKAWYMAAGPRMGK